jgi:class 3 adenylate cyclase
MFAAMHLPNRGWVRTARATGRSALEHVRPWPSAGARRSVRVPRSRSGIEVPRDLADTIPLVERSFAFVDLCGFTHFMSCHGEHAAIEALSTFRSLTRSIATRRGVIVEKWLGDGALLVGGEVGPTIATAAELIARYQGQRLTLRGGFADGWVVIFDGDDYIGRPANLASRLCHASRPDELLAVDYPATSLPSWVEVRGTRGLTLRGIGRLRRVQRLGLVPDLELPPLDVDAHPGGREWFLNQASRVDGGR